MSRADGLSDGDLILVFEDKKEGGERDNVGSKMMDVGAGVTVMMVSPGTTLARGLGFTWYKKRDNAICCTHTQ